MEKLTQWLQQNEITEVECVMCDFTGIGRGKIAPLNKFLQEQGMRLPESVLVQTVTGDFIADKVYDALIDQAEIDFLCKPDENCAYLLPWTSEKTALIIHDVFHKDGSPIAFASRNVLKKILHLYAEKNWQPIIAPEIEFYLTKKNDDPDYPLQPPIGRSGRREYGRQPFSIAATNEFDPLFEDMYEWAEKQNLDIDTLIHEEGTAQLEVNFRHGEPLSIADQTFVFKRTLREAAEKHNMVATFMAKPVAGEPGSSLHLHQSILHRSTGENIFWHNNNYTDIFYHYIGGLQRYVPQMLPIFAPSINSFRRFQPDQDVPINFNWGIDNRTCGLRIPHSDGANTRIENRIAGADTNCYLAIAASLLSGYLGMIENIEPSKQTIGKGNTTVHKLFSANLEASLQTFERNKKLQSYLSKEFVQAYTAVKRAELKNFNTVISSWERQFLLTTV